MNNSPPTDEERAALQRAIDDERDRTKQRITDARKSFDDIVGYAEGSPPDDEHDPEGATIGFERAKVSALLTHAEEHLGALDAAERRLHGESYGICERCGQRIVLDRLLARPAAVTCTSCS